jgi:hypothetical protein
MTLLLFTLRQVDSIDLQWRDFSRARRIPSFSFIAHA